MEYGEDDLETLINWYGAVQKGEFPGDEEQVSTVDPIINPGETREEYKNFKKLVKLEQSKFKKDKQKAVKLVERQLNNIRKHNNASRDKRRTAKLEEELKDLNAKDMMLSDIYTVVCKPENSFWMPNVKKLVLLALLSPVGNAVVERLFSLMNITKTLLRNCLGDKNLDILLRLNKEAPEAWTNEEKDDLVELWIARKRNKEQKFRWKL